jgi:MOSC domain-containing protein YiiM
VQARFQLLRLGTVLPLAEVRVVGRDPQRAAAFAERMRDELGIPVSALTDHRAAVSGADVVTCATTSSRPVFSGGHLAPGTHVDAVGAFRPATREVDTFTIRKSRVVVDTYEGAWEEAGDLLIPIKAGIITRRHVKAEQDEVVAGTKPGRTSPREVRPVQVGGVRAGRCRDRAARLRPGDRRGPGQRGEVMSGSARIVQISVSPGGAPKRPVPSARVTALGLQGDAQRDREHHGGPDRALCLFSRDRIRALRAEGHPITPGSIGENLTIEGIDWNTVMPRSYLLLGEDVIVQVTQYTAPCANITASFLDRDYSRVSAKRHPGDSRVYARVLREGALTNGDPVQLLPEDEALALIGPR